VDSLGKLVFVGLGLYDCSDLTLRGLRALEEADAVYLEAYTNLVPGLSLQELEEIAGKKIKVLGRRDLEERSGLELIEEVRDKVVVLLVPGDPFIATTHVAVRLEAEKRGVETEVVHAPSILSAAASSTGLQPYKFGKLATLVYPRPEHGFYPLSTYETLADNLSRGLHTLLLLDLRVEEGVYMSVRDAVEVLYELEERAQRGIVSGSTLGVGLARIGSPDQVIKAGTLEELRELEFGPPPHSLAIPGRLHPLEAEALVVLCGCRRELVDRWLK